MPIYEFICPRCGQAFEKLVFASDEEKTPSCPDCGNTQTEKLMSAFSCGKGVTSGSTGFSTSNPCSPQAGFS